MKAPSSPHRGHGGGSASARSPLQIVAIAAARTPAPRNMDDTAAKAKLLAAGDSGVSVHAHLCSLIEKLLDTPDPTTALASLENLSLQVKKERAALTPAATVNVRRAPPRRTGQSRAPT